MKKSFYNKLAGFLCCIALGLASHALAQRTEAADSLPTRRALADSFLLAKTTLYVSPLSIMNPIFPGFQLAWERQVNNYTSLVGEAAFLYGYTAIPYSDSRSSIENTNNFLQHGVRLRLAARAFLKPLTTQHQENRYLGAELLFKHARLRDYWTQVGIDSDPSRPGFEYTEEQLTKDRETLVAFSIKGGFIYKLPTVSPFLSRLVFNGELGGGFVTYINSLESGIYGNLSSERPIIPFGSVDFRIGYIIAKQ